MLTEDYMSKKESIAIPRAALIGIAPAIAIAAILISKGDIGPLILLIIGISLGVLIGRGYYLK